jgi:hypothetical protein
VSFSVAPGGFPVKSYKILKNENITINVSVVYMARDEMILLGADPISWAIGRGGP